MIEGVEDGCGFLVESARFRGDIEVFRDGNRRKFLLEMAYSILPIVDEPEIVSGERPAMGRRDFKRDEGRTGFAAFVSPGGGNDAFRVTLREARRL